MPAGGQKASPPPKAADQRLFESFFVSVLPRPGAAGYQATLMYGCPESKPALISAFPPASSLASDDERETRTKDALAVPEFCFADDPFVDYDRDHRGGSVS